MAKQIELCQMYVNPCGPADYDIAYLYYFDDEGVKEWRATHQKLCRSCCGDVIQSLDSRQLIKLEKI